MKTGKRILALVLTVVMMMSVLVVGASAANTSDTTITNFSLSWFWFSEINARDKQDSSPVYLYYNTGKRTTVQVKAIGCDDDHADQNLTLSNGTIADYVTCAKGVKYSIHTMIFEKGYSQAKLAFKSPNVFGDTITGKWSPDSQYTYTSAT